MRQWDICLGTAGAAATWNLAELNSALACLVGILTVVLMCFRVRREFLRRNAGFSEDAKGRMKTDFRKELDDDSIL